jgi:non-homologous end joining protein Ku
MGAVTISSRVPVHYPLPASTEAKRIRLNQLNPETGNRGARQLVASKIGKIVDRDQIVKGYKFQPRALCHDHR